MNTAYTFVVDADAVNTGDFRVLPAGWYSAQVDEAEFRATKNGNGQYISTRFRLIGNESFNNRCVWDMFHTVNSEKAVEVGKKRMNAMLHYMGLTEIANLNEICGNDVMILVGVQKSEGYPDKNVVRGFRAVA